MLSNSPGGVAFERAPFKLTSEYLHILGSDARGRRSPAFDYFRVRAAARRRHFDCVPAMLLSHLRYLTPIQPQPPVRYWYAVIPRLSVRACGKSVAALVGDACRT